MIVKIYVKNIANKIYFCCLKLDQFLMKLKIALFINS